MYFYGFEHDTESSESEKLRVSQGLPIGSKHSSFLKCECGADITYGPQMAISLGLHSDFCPLKNIKPLDLTKELNEGDYSGF